MRSTRKFLDPDGDEYEVEIDGEYLSINDGIMTMVLVFKEPEKVLESMIRQGWQPTENP